jgi:hypothetical protein
VVGAPARAYRKPRFTGTRRGWSLSLQALVGLDLSESERCRILHRRSLAISVLLLSCLIATAKDKKKALLPADVLQAHTVLVVVDPRAGTDIQNPNANRTAQEDVEKALMEWGRFSLALDARTADLIIMVRKGSGKIAQPTLGGIPNNNRPVVLEPTNSGGRIGVIPGSAPDPSPQPQVEVGQSQDMFVVYRCTTKDDENWDPLDAPPVWRYTANDALQSPGVPAVEVFRKVIADSEKQLAKTP